MVGISSGRFLPFIGSTAVVAGIVVVVIGLRMVLPGSNPRLTSKRLTEIEQEQLAGLVVTFLPGEPIAACLWEDAVRATSSMS